MIGAVVADYSGMSRLRRPVPAAEAFALVFAAGAGAVTAHWTGRLSEIQLLLLLPLLEFIVQPVSTLIHELGHAFAACRQGAQRVVVVVGRGPRLQFSLGRIRVHFGLVPSCSGLCRGVCRYDSKDLSWRSHAAIALSGPAATLLEFLTLLAFAPRVWHAATGFERQLIAFALVLLVMSLIVNLSPMRIKRDGRVVLIGNDFAKARVAIRMHRQGAPLSNPSLSASIQVSAAQAAGVLDRDSDRKRTSIPPPSYRRP
jgi:hypothetical protein